MSMDYLTHYITAILCLCVAFWGDKLGIPATDVSIAATLVPGIIGHALGMAANGGTK